MLDECLLAVNGMGCGYMCGGAGEGGEKSRVWSGIESRGHRPDIDRLLSRKQVGECGTGWMGWAQAAGNAVLQLRCYVLCPDPPTTT